MTGEVLPPKPPAVDHDEQSKMASLFAALLQPLRTPLFDSGKHVRAGVTKNKMQPRNKRRVLMARESRRRNRA
jgi:hypothetical protein